MDAATVAKACTSRSPLAIAPAASPANAPASTGLPLARARSLTPHIVPASRREPLSDAATGADADAADPHQHDCSTEPAHSEPPADGPPAANATDDDDDAKHDDTDSTAGDRAAGPDQQPTYDEETKPLR